MAYAIFHHEYEEATKEVMYDQVYSEPKPFIGGFLGFVGTVYKPLLLSFKEKTVRLGICKKCGKKEGVEEHKIIHNAKTL